MLDRSDELILAEKLAQLPCRVKIPAELKGGFEKSGPTPTGDTDARRHPRFFWRGEKRKAALEYRSTLPALPREAAWFGVLLGNISRGGLACLHHEPLYPRERFRLLLPTGRFAEIEVNWCRRIGEDCFEIGARFAAELPPDDMRRFLR